MWLVNCPGRTLEYDSFIHNVGVISDIIFRYRSLRKDPRFLRQTVHNLCVWAINGPKKDYFLSYKQASNAIELVEARKQHRISDNIVAKRNRATVHAVLLNSQF